MSGMNIMDGADISFFEERVRDLIQGLPCDGPSEDRILERNAPPLPSRLSSDEWPVHDPQIEFMAQLLGESGIRIFLFNKNHPSERFCPACRTRYKRPTVLSSRAEEEQDLSGVCRSKCFIMINGPDGYSREEWMGQKARKVETNMKDGRSVAITIKEPE